MSAAALIADPWTVNLLVSLAALHPLWRIFRRAGLNPWPSFLIFVPILGWAAVGSILAFKPWPDVVPHPKPGKG